MPRTSLPVAAALMLVVACGAGSSKRPGERSTGPRRPVPTVATTRSWGARWSRIARDANEAVVHSCTRPAGRLEQVIGET